MFAGSKRKNNISDSPTHPPALPHPPFHQTQIVLVQRGDSLERCIVSNVDVPAMRCRCYYLDIALCDEPPFDVSWADMHELHQGEILS